MKTLLFLLALTLGSLAPATLNAADLTITAANVVPGPNAVIKFRKAGATLTAGQLVYIDTDQSVKVYDANGASATIRTLYGIAGTGASAGQQVGIIISDDSLAIGATVAVGDVLIGSATAGSIAPAADAATGWYVTVLGVAKSTTTINFNPTASGAAK